MLPKFAYATGIPTDATQACFFENPSTTPSGDTFGVTSNMGPRNIPHGSPDHKGTDYATPCGTTIKGPPAGCKKIGGSTLNHNGNAGYNASFDCGNGVKVTYMHLQGANAYDATNNTITTGKSGTKACHLHYQMTIDGQAVEAQCSTGKPSTTNEIKYGNSSKKHGHKCPVGGAVDLCKQENRDALKQHSEKVWGGKVTASVPSGPSTPADPNHDDHDHGTPVGEEELENPTHDPDKPIEEPPTEPTEDDKKDPKNPESPFNPEASKPRCDNSTCITTPMIENAKHKRVDDDKQKSHLEWILPPGEAPATECKNPPHKTGVTIYRQTSEGNKGKLKEYLDAFCINQGCTYVNEKMEGIGKCEPPK